MVRMLGLVVADRSSHFAEGSLWNCLQAVAANLALFDVRFGPFYLFHGAGTLAAFVNQLFAIELKDCLPSSFYVPAVSLPTNHAMTSFVSEPKS